MQTKFRLEIGSEVEIHGIRYQIATVHENGYLMLNAANNGIEELLRHEDIADLALRGQIKQLGCRNKIEVKSADKNATAEISVLSDDQRWIINGRHAFVRAYLSLKQDGVLKSTDQSIGSSMYAIAVLAEKLAAADAPVKLRTSSRPKQALLPEMPSARTLRRWTTSYLAHGLMALRPAANTNRAPRIEPASKNLMMRAVHQYLSKDRPNYATVYTTLRMLFAEENARRTSVGEAELAVPSRESLRKELKKLNPYQVHLARYGLESANRKFSPVGTGRSDATRPLELVIMDCWRIDLIVLLTKLGAAEHLDAATREKLDNLPKERMWLCVAICAATRCILGMRLSRTVGSEVAVSTLRMVTEDKGAWADAVGAVSPWGMCGIPERLVTDAGMEFSAGRLIAATEDLGISAARAPAGQPQLRGEMERLFGTIGAQLVQRLSGRTFSNVLERAGADAEGEAALTEEDLSHALVRYIVDIYHNSPHSALGGRTPAQEWKTLVGFYGVTPPPDMRKRRIVFGTTLSRKVTNTGIQVMGIRYHSDQLAMWFLSAIDRTVPVRWFDQDLGAIEVQLDGKWHEVAAVHRAFDGRTAQDWARTAHDLRDNRRRNEKLYEETILRAFADIDAVNAAAIRKADLTADPWTAERVERAEQDLFISFRVETEAPPAAPATAASFGTSVLTSTGQSDVCADTQSERARAELADRKKPKSWEF